MGIASDQRLFERPAFKAINATGGESYVPVIDSRPYVNRSNMSARAIISTATEDRVGDILNPRGCSLKNYAKNPVVLYGHGLEDIKTPIGTSRDPSGNLAIEITDDVVMATCFFSQRSQEAAQIFELIDEGVIVATSVRETPFPGESRIKAINGRRVNFVNLWDLEEWSWCAIGVNPDAVAKAIRRRVDGRQLSQSILKSLNAVMPPKRVLGVGSTMKTDDDEPDNDADDKKDDPAMPTVRDNPMDNPPVDSTKQVDVPGPRVGTLFNNTGSDVDDEKPHGQKMIAATHESMKSLCKSIDQGRKQLENTDVHKWLDGVAKSLDEHCTTAEGLHQEQYPGAKPLGESMKDEDGEEADDESEMKSFLADNNPSRLTVMGVGARLKSLSAEASIPPKFRTAFSQWAEMLLRTATAAKSHRPAEVIARSAERLKPVESPEEERQKLALEAQLEELRSTLKSFGKAK
jgi:hypothetical protein